MAITQYNINSYCKGVNGFGLPFTNTSYSATLAANTDTAITVPGLQASGAPGAIYAKMYALIDYSGGSVWVANNAAATLPAGAAFAQTNSELNPVGKYVKAGDVLHFITSAANVEVNVAFFAVQD